jgi:hypothetical protein
MAKHKYEKKTVVDAIGILDTNEDDKLVLIIDDVEFDFIEMAKQAVGTEVHFKSDLIEV